MFSSDSQDSDSFLIVNRDVGYLKDISASFLNTFNISRSIDADYWVGYTEFALSKRHTKKKAKKPARKKKVGNKKASSSELYSPQEKSKEQLFEWPIDKKRFWISSFFGSRKKPNGLWGFHYGIDMASLRGTPVRAAGDGIVVEARYAKGYGNTIVIAHNRKYKTRYAHLDKIKVRVGQKVKKRTLIGNVGRTGLVWKPQGKDPSHLHFEVYAFGKRVNPIIFLSSS